jgi:hypothetical protein
MITLNVINDSIVGSIGEEPFSITYSKELYTALLAKADDVNAATTMEEYSTLVEEFKALTAIDDFQTLIEHKVKDIYIDRKTNEYFLKVNDVISTIPMPKALVTRLEESLDKGIDTSPLIKFWIRFLRNPILRKKMESGQGQTFIDRVFNFVNMMYVHPKVKADLIEKGFSEEVATTKATMYQCKITNEGLLNGYKVSREVLHKFDAETAEVVDRYKRTFNVDTGEIESDGIPSIVEERLFEPAVMGNSGDAFWCEGLNGYSKPQHFIKVGCTHRLDSWSHVNIDDYTSCVPGLHVGGLIYISGYSGEIHNVFIDPMHIGAVPDDNSGAIRCLQYFVHSSLVGINGAIYHSSTYASKTDAEWEEMKKAAVKAFGQVAQKAVDNAGEISSL